MNDFEILNRCETYAQFCEVVDQMSSALSYSDAPSRFQGLGRDDEAEGWF